MFLESSRIKAQEVSQPSLVEYVQSGTGSPAYVSMEVIDKVTTYHGRGQLNSQKGQVAVELVGSRAAENQQCLQNTQNTYAFCLDHRSIDLCSIVEFILVDDSVLRCSTV
jgi:hypothetical protein